MVKKPFLVALQSADCKHTIPVKNKLPEISRRIFQKITMQIIEILKYSTFPSFILMGDSTTESLLASLKAEALAANFCGRFSFLYNFCWLYVWLPCNRLCNLTFPHKWRCYETQLIIEILKIFRKKSMVKFILVKLYSEQTPTLL